MDRFVIFNDENLSLADADYEATKAHIAKHQEPGLRKYTVYAGEPGPDQVETSTVLWVDSADAQ